MKIKDIYHILDTISPFCLQEKWDNSGINIGDLQDDIKNIILSLDIDSKLIEKVPCDTLIITHHPLIFTPIKQIDKSFPSMLIRKMIKKNISLISMHTNFDKTHLNQYVLEKVLEFKTTSKDGFISYANIDMSFSSLLKHIKQKFKLDYTKVINTKEHIKTLALTTGAGASLIKEVRADCFITGDIKYHDAMMAKELGLAMIDIGHFESEIFFGDILQEELNKQDISTEIINSQSPFSYKNL